MLVLRLRAYDRELIDREDAAQKSMKIERLTKAAKSFVLHVGMAAVAGNVKHNVAATALRHRPREARGDNFNGICVRDGTEVVIQELACANEWALVRTSDGSG